MEVEYVELKPKEINWPKARLLSEEEQAQYEEAIQKYSGKAIESLDIIRKGSNLFKVLLLNEIGIKTATMSQLDQMGDINRDFLEGYYEDSPSVVLRSNGDSHKPNDYLAKSLAKTMKKRNFKHSYVLNGLKIKEDKNSAYGLILVPREDFNFFEAPELDNENGGKNFSELDEKALPIFSKDGDRILYTREDGLSRLYLNVGLHLDSYDGGLDHSSDFGRVVVVEDLKE